MEDKIVKSQHYEIVKFNSTELVCPIINGEPFVVMKCIFDDLKMHTKKATGTLKKHPRFGPRVAEWQPVESIGSLSNKHPYVCLPIHKIAGWLYSVSINRVSEEVKELLFIYQEKCDDVLFITFFGGKNNIVRYKELALPISNEIKEKETELQNETLILQKSDQYIKVDTLKRELSKLKTKKRNLERSILEPQLF